MRKKTLNDYWKEIFEKYDIISEIKNNGSFKITANQIREFKEPRLMTKFDFSYSRPEIFRKHNLSILPITNGVYIIGNFNLYKKIREINHSPKIIDMPSHIKTIDPDNIYSEANALHVTVLTGMLEKVVGEKLSQTISGRMRANGFNFSVEDVNDESHKIRLIIEKPQIEIDGGYEGNENVVLVEAKNKQPSDFIIRQLYYPYRYWKDKVNKNIVPIFFTYDSGTYNFYVYQFDNVEEYNSIRLIKTERYIVKYTDAEKRLKDIYNSIEPIDDLPQSMIPFPQANSFTRIIELLVILEDCELTTLEVADYFHFDIRQGNYYIAAAKYLSLVESHNLHRNIHKLSETGIKISMFDSQDRNIALIKQILKHKVFYNTLTYYYENKQTIDKKWIIFNIQKELELEYSIAERRASTVISWIRWITSCNI